MPSLFEEADIAADTLRRQPGFVPEDLRIMFRLAQRQHHPNYSDDQFGYLFDIWHDGYTARRNAEKEAASARMLVLLKERDELADRREKLPFTDRAVVTERISVISAEIADMLGRERKPPTEGASWA